MRQKYSADEHEKQSQQKYMQLKKQCTLSRSATYGEYIEWFIKRYGVYQNYVAAFISLLKDLGFPQATCEIRENIEDEQRKHLKKSFDEIVLMDPSVRMREIDRMSGQQFEGFLTWLYTEIGFGVWKTKKAADQGADLILHRHTRIAVQAKRRKKKISNKAVQEVNSARSYYQCTDAWVVTSNYFTKNAIELARCCNVELVDRDRLNDMISRARF